jgi:hypothetical protein
MARLLRSRRRPRVAVVDPPTSGHQPGIADPVIETGDISVLVRAYLQGDPPHSPAPSAVKPTMLTIARSFADDIQDRQIQVFVDVEPWGKVRYGSEISRDIRPGRHIVRVFNTLFSQTMEVEAHGGEHVRLRCGNGFPRAGYLMMLFFHVTYLRVRLERETGSP